MSHYIRAYRPGGIFFFTIVTYNRKPFLTTPLAREILKKSWLNVQRRHPFHTDAFCLLPDHLHCIITLPEEDSEYAIRWSAIKGNFSREYRKHISDKSIQQTASRTKRRELPFWQRRYWEHTIRNEKDYQRHIDYIHYNPVKHGLSTRTVEYPWSTFHRFVKSGMYTTDWGISDKIDISGDFWGE